MAANDRQVGGDHYKQAGKTGEEHWDRVKRLSLDYWQACATKYIERCWDKMGLQDIDKAIHYLEKYKEVSAGRKGAMEPDFTAQIVNSVEFRQAVDSGMQATITLLDGRVYTVIPRG